MIGRITGDGNPFDAWGNGNYAVNLPHAMSVVDKSPQHRRRSSTAPTPATRATSAIPARVLDNVTMLAKAAKPIRASPIT